MKDTDKRGTVIFLVCVFLKTCETLEPTSTIYFGAGLGLSGVYAGWNYLKCYMYECCNTQWISANITRLDFAFRDKLYGQHLVRQTVIPSLKGHFKNKEPKKALVFSFHGWTGGGKNFVSRLIAENLFYKGMKSSFVHLFIATRDFPFQDKAEIYKQQLQDKIEKAVKVCEYSLFIFDEVDKMPLGLIDALKPFIDYHENVNGVDYRKAIYIFLSNTGGKEITKVAYQFWKNGKERKQLTLKEMEPLVSKGAFNEIGGLHNSEIIEKHLIDIHIPFLPLEKSHVKLCIQDSLISKGYKLNLNIVDQVANELEYFPSDVLLFSVSGCKKIDQKINMIVLTEDEDDNYDEL